MARRLSLEETKKCLIAWREFNDKDALTLLFMCNSGLVGFIAKKYLSSGLTFDELVSAGNEGLLNAINKFDYKQRKTQEEVGNIFGVTGERIRQIEDKALKKLRHPKIIRKLKDFIDE